MAAPTSKSKVASLTSVIPGVVKVSMDVIREAYGVSVKSAADVKRDVKPQSSASDSSARRS